MFHVTRPVGLMLRRREGTVLSQPCTDFSPGQVTVCDGYETPFHCTLVYLAHITVGQLSDTDMENAGVKPTDLPRILGVSVVAPDTPLTLFRFRRQDG